MTELNKTVFYDLHCQLGAKMVPFAGYEMPVQYQAGIISEHLHCRSKAGWFDISHMGQAILSGDSAASFLEQLTPAKIQPLAVNSQRYTVLTNDEGGVIDDIIITRLADRFLLVVNAACKQEDFAYLAKQLPDDCTLTLLEEQALIALQGPKAEQVLQLFVPEISGLNFLQAIETAIDGQSCIISRSGYTGEDGFELSISNQYAVEFSSLILANNLVSPIGLGARDTLRLEAGLSLYGHELTTDTTPVDAGLQWLIQRQEGFPGDKAICKQLAAGAALKRIGLVVDGKIPVREGCPLVDGDNNPVGKVTSGSYSPSLGKPIALAQINTNNEDEQFYAQIRNHKIRLQKIALPFMKHHYRR
ncbi:glycine cleavage system protein T [Methylophaga sp. 41_12_T18]|nr:glycine cleavage system protein T [Methylophaga sp. 41_12_T18]